MSIFNRKVFFIPEEIINILFCFKFLTAEHAEIAESNHSKDKIQKVSSFLCLYIFILLCGLRALGG